MAKTEEEKAIGQFKILCLAGLLIGAFLLFNPVVIVGAGERGVIMNWGAVSDDIWGEGMHFRVPIMQDIQTMSVQTQKYSAQAASASKDLQDVNTEVTLNYHLDSLQVNKVYQTMRKEYQERVIAPAVQESVKASTAAFTAEELITKRPLAKDEIENALRERLIGYGIFVETVSITNFQFSPEFTQSIEAKVTAEQLALKAKNDLERIKTEAEQTVASATAEAQAIKITGDALKENPQLIQLEWVKKWDGKTPIVMGSGMNMLDITGMIGAAQ